MQFIKLAGPFIVLSQLTDLLTCNSTIVCSNLGPDIAVSLGCWLLDQIAALFGSCLTLSFSPVSTLSTNISSCCCFVFTGNSFVFDKGTLLDDALLELEKARIAGIEVEARARRVRSSAARLCAVESIVMW